MQFTDRYIKVPISTHNVKEKELTGVENNIETWFKFLPFELACYYPSYTEDEPDVEIVKMTLKCGDSTLVNLSPIEFEKLINDFAKEAFTNQ